MKRGFGHAPQRKRKNGGCRRPECQQRQQAAALGVRAAQTTQTSASDAVRSRSSKADSSMPKTKGELTTAPIENDVLHGDRSGEVEDDDDTER